MVIPASRPVGINLSFQRQERCPIIWHRFSICAPTDKLTEICLHTPKLIIIETRASVRPVPSDLVARVRAERKENICNNPVYVVVLVHNKLNIAVK